MRPRINSVSIRGDGALISGCARPVVATSIRIPRRVAPPHRDYAMVPATPPTYRFPFPDANKAAAAIPTISTIRARDLKSCQAHHPVANATAHENARATRFLSIFPATPVALLPANHENAGAFHPVNEQSPDADKHPPQTPSIARDWLQSGAIAAHCSNESCSAECPSP